VIGGLLPARVYTMRLLAVNSIDQSAFTEAVIVKTQEEEPSEAPKDVRVDSVGPGELFLTWAVPARESWNGELLGYIVSWNEHGGLPNQTKSLTVKGWATTKLQLTGLRKFTRYDINVRAFNSISTGPASPTVIGTTKEGVPEAPPQDIICSQISSQSMKISWTPPPQTLHGGLIQGYKVYYRPLPNENGKTVYC
jgi:Down syndrome cell adhesion protein